MALRVPHSKYFRYRLFDRQRHAKKVDNFIGDVLATLNTTQSARTVVPVRTTNTKAEALIVIGSQPANNDTLQIGVNTYTFKTALSEVKANADLVTDATNPADGSTVTIGSTVYTFQTVLTPGTAGQVHVLIGANAAASLLNLTRAINGTGGTPGTDYSTTGTGAHADVTSSSSVTGGTTITVTAAVAGGAGNAIGLVASTAPDSHIDPESATLTGGVNAVAYEVLRGADAAASLANVVAAITGGAGSGTTYSTGTTAHPLVTAAAATNDLLVTVLSASTPGLTVPIAKSSSALTLPGSSLDGPAWTATAHGFTDGEGPVLLTSTTTLPAGSPTGQLWVHVINANRIALATSLEALRKGIFVQTTDAGTGTHSLTRSVTDRGIFDTLKRNKPRTVAVEDDIDDLV